MLVTVPTLLARAKRNRQTVLSCVVSTFEIAEIVEKVAVATKQAFILTVDGHNLGLLAQVLYWGRASKYELGVEVLLSESKELIDEVLSFGQLTLTLRSKDQELLQYAVRRAHAHGSDCLASLSLQHGIEHILDTIHQTGVQGVRLTAHTGSDTSRVVPHELKDILHHAKVPVIADAHGYSPTSIQKMLKLGIAGVSIGTELDEAFTAGLRTGLRDRTLTLPQEYLPKARKAVEQTLFTYLTFINS